MYEQKLSKNFKTNELLLKPKDQFNLLKLNDMEIKRSILKDNLSKNASQ